MNSIELEHHKKKPIEGDGNFMEWKEGLSKELVLFWRSIVEQYEE